MSRSLLIPAALLAINGAALGAEEIVESVAGADFEYGAFFTPVEIEFTTTRPVTGFGLTGDWEFVAGDTENFFFPWSFDLRANITDPGMETAFLGAPFTGGANTIDFPINDGTGPVLSGKGGPGTFLFEWFDANGQPGSLARVSNPVYHATTTVPDVTFSYTAEPDPATSWDRPFFFELVSGIGPTSYDVLEFTVETAGKYDFESVLSTGEDHFTLLYAGSFDDASPLEGLADFGLGNGGSPFGEPRGTSGFSALLFPGETYYWVTSTFRASSGLDPSLNSIVGPGEITVIPAPGAGVLAVLGLLGVRRRRG